MATLRASSNQNVAYQEKHTVTITEPSLWYIEERLLQEAQSLTDEEYERRKEDFVRIQLEGNKIGYAHRMVLRLVVDREDSRIKNNDLPRTLDLTSFPARIFDTIMSFLYVSKMWDSLEDFNYLDIAFHDLGMPIVRESLPTRLRPISERDYRLLMRRYRKDPRTAQRQLTVLRIGEDGLIEPSNEPVRVLSGPVNRGNFLVWLGPDGRLMKRVLKSEADPVAGVRESPEHPGDLAISNRIFDGMSTSGETLYLWNKGIIFSLIEEPRVEVVTFRWTSSKIEKVVALGKDREVEWAVVSRPKDKPQCIRGIKQNRRFHVSGDVLAISMKYVVRSQDGKLFIDFHDEFRFKETKEVIVPYVVVRAEIDGDLIYLEAIDG